MTKNGKSRGKGTACRALFIYNEPRLPDALTPDILVPIPPWVNPAPLAQPFCPVIVDGVLLIPLPAPAPSN